MDERGSRSGRRPEHRAEPLEGPKPGPSSGSALERTYRCIGSVDDDAEHTEEVDGLCVPLPEVVLAISPAQEIPVYEIARIIP